MVKEYLEKYLIELVEERILVEHEYTDCENKIKENISFIALLEEKNDPNFESFTPREVNTSNKKKIAELREEQKRLLDLSQKKKLELSDFNAKIDELNSVIRVAREAEKPGDELITNVDDNVILRRKLLETQEAERQRIARELHDSSVQSMTGLVHKAELCYRLIDIDPVRCKMELKNMSKFTKEIIDELRDMIYNLRPMSFDDIGIDTAIERNLARLQDGSDTKINYYVQGSSEEMSPVVGLTLLRIIYEACSNAVHHANAKEVNVRLIYSEDHIDLSIEDDGDGFELENLRVGDDRTGFGLPIMKERVFLLSGEMDIQSELGKGTTITITVPLKVEEMLPE
ncbi:MAG: ATP-binding protein [Lachnospiraceae bacterium]|nr:ATP-binding protein [Lachnospiraceae bacterium]